MYTLGVDEWVANFRKWAGNWPEMARAYFAASYGLDPTFAVKAAALYLALWALGKNPRVTSGFRSPTKQAAMRAAWDRGERAGLVVRPADPKASMHCQGTDSRPASLAIDMPCDDNALGARVAEALGLRAGQYFKVPDPGHYDNGAL